MGVAAMARPGQPTRLDFLRRQRQVVPRPFVGEFRAGVWQGWHSVWLVGFAGRALVVDDWVCRTSAQFGLRSAPETAPFLRQCAPSKARFRPRAIHIALPIPTDPNQTPPTAQGTSVADHCLCRCLWPMDDTGTRAAYVLDKLLDCG